MRKINLAVLPQRLERKEKNIVRVKVKSNKNKNQRHSCENEKKITRYSKSKVDRTQASIWEKEKG